MVGERVFGAPQGRFFLFGGVKHHFRVKMQSFLFDFETLGVGDKFVELSLDDVFASTRHLNVTGNHFELGVNILVQILAYGVRRRATAHGCQG